MVAPAGAGDQPHGFQHADADLCSRGHTYDPRPCLAHIAGGGALPAPPWLLSYIGVAGMLGTAAVLRATWPSARFRRRRGRATGGTTVGPGNVIGLAAPRGRGVRGHRRPGLGAPPTSRLRGVPHLVRGPPDRLPARRRRHARHQPVRPARGARGPLVRPATVHARRPAWTSAAFLAAFIWYFIAYYRPGSPRSLAVFLVAYVCWRSSARGLGARLARRRRGVRRAVGRRRPDRAAPARRRRSGRHGALMLV